MKLWHADTKMTYNTVSAIYGCVTNMALCVTNTQWLRTTTTTQLFKSLQFTQGSKWFISPFTIISWFHQDWKIQEWPQTKSGISTKMTATGQHLDGPLPLHMAFPTPGASLLPGTCIQKEANSGFLTQHSRQQASKNCKASCSLDPELSQHPSTRFYLYKQVMGVSPDLVRRGAHRV